VRPCQFSPIQYLQQLNRLAGTAKYLKIRARQVSQRVRVRVLRKSTKSHSRARHGDSRTPTLIKAGAEKWAADAAATSQSTLAPPQHRLYFLSEAQGHGSFRSVFGRSAPTVVVKITPFQDDPLGRRFSRGLVAGRVSAGRSVHKRKATFWATLKGHRRRETAPPLAKNTSVATQQGPKPPNSNPSIPARFAVNREHCGKVVGSRLCAMSTPANSGKRTRLVGSMSEIA
jgi:hypothetical protein